MQPLVPDTHYPIDLDLLPNTWTVAYIGDVIRDIRTGFSSGKHNKDGLGVVHLRPMNIDRRGQIVLSDIRYVAADNDIRVLPGDVLFNNTNSAELVGKTAPIVEEADWAFSNHMTRLRPPVSISHRFVAYQLHFLWLTRYFRYRSTQHVNQASISIRTLAESVPLIVPPSNEQFRIVAEIEKQIGRLNHTEASLNNAMLRLEEYSKAVLRQVVEGNLVPTEDELAQQTGRSYEPAAQLLRRIRDTSSDLNHEKQLTLLEEDTPSLCHASPKPDVQVDLPMADELPELPEGWLWVPISSVGQVTLGRQRAPQHHSGEHMRPYLRVANVFDDRIDVSDVLQMNFTPEEYEMYRLEIGDILLNEGQSLELVGRAAMFKNEVPGACFQNTLIRFRAYPCVLPAYALIVFRHYFHTKRYQRIAKWSTNIAHLGASRFARLEFPLPPIAEQERIIAEAERNLSISNKQKLTIQAVLTRVAHLRNRIYRLAFTGKLVLQDPSDTPADILLKDVHGANNPSNSRTSRRKGNPTLRQRDETMATRRALFDVLSNAKSEMKPEDLLRQSGIGEDLIEEFFLELRREIAEGRIEEWRDPNGNDVYLFTKRTEL